MKKLTSAPPHIGVMCRYREMLPVTEETPLISLGEGDTPLVRAPHLEEMLGAGELYLKLEGCNPTGSFKDRGMVVAIAKALEAGSRAVICASTGNTSAAAAAYAARAGLDAIVLVPENYVALGKLAQAIVYGARVVMVRGNFDDALRLVRELSERHPVTLVNSVNPYRLQGQKTAAFELCDSLGDAPDILALPVGNAGNISAYWMGFKEYHQAGKSSKLPRMVGFQAEGAAPIVRGEPVKKPETIATAIRIGNPASWSLAVAARDESGGLIDCVTDQEILEAYQLLTSREGVFVEPASATPIAGLRKMVAQGRLELTGLRVVCVLTGNGLKDPDTAVKLATEVLHVPPTLEGVEEALGWK
ncbi:MAG TPA: threonine synthase [Chloroflexota bacterium]|nr:threonine synthase [Chloroflexota bacterium]